MYAVQEAVMLTRIKAKVRLYETETACGVLCYQGKKQAANEAVVACQCKDEERASNCQYLMSCICVDVLPPEKGALRVENFGKRTTKGQPQDAVEDSRDCATTQ